MMKRSMGQTLGRFRPVASFATLLGVLVLLVSGCGDDGGSTPQTQAPNVTVRSPNGGETFYINVSYGVEYTATDPDTPSSQLTISIEYSTDGGSHWTAVASNLPNSSPYVWVVPGPQSSQCKVRVTASDGANTGSDTSDGFFSISALPTEQSTLSIGSGTGEAGSEVRVALTLNNRAAVTSLQTDILFDPAVVSYTRGEADDRGAAMTYSGTLMEAGRVRVGLSYGDDSTLPAGNGVIGNLTFTLIGAGGSQTDLTPSSILLLDPGHGELPVGGNAGSITIEEAGPTAEELTTAGWTKFEAGDFDGALDDFEAAIGVDAAYGPAYLGQGWARLSLATSSTAFNQAVDSFGAAIDHGENGADAKSGRAAANLGAGNHSAAISDAASARAADPAFVFAHRSSFNVDDLFLIEAFGQAGLPSFTDAIAAANEVSASGIQEGNPSTWIVEGTTYPSFEAAVLAWLHKLSADVAG